MHALLDRPGDLTRRDGGLAGMTEAVAALLRDALAAPSGILVVAGPPDSGKARTIEAALAFRQDGSSAIVGEIGDPAAADAAVQAALGGQYVLATIVAGDAVAAIARLRELRVEPWLVASTLRAVVAQRQVRRLCAGCRRQVQSPAALSALLGFDRGAIVWQADGCAACGHSGSDGRIGLFEAVALDRTLRRLISGGGDPAILASHAFRDRPNLGGAARAMVREGHISGEDAVRISRGG